MTDPNTIPKRVFMLPPIAVYLPLQFDCVKKSYRGTTSWLPDLCSSLDRLNQLRVSRSKRHATKERPAPRQGEGRAAQFHICIESGLRRLIRSEKKPWFASRKKALNATECRRWRLSIVQMHYKTAIFLAGSRLTEPPAAFFGSERDGSIVPEDFQMPPAA
jgi:hypothetical protein